MIYIADVNHQNYIQRLVPDSLVGCLSDGRHFCLFATNEDQLPVSVLISEVRDGLVRLLWLFSDEEHRHCGYARSLIDRLVEVAKQAGGIDRVIVCIPADQPSIQFFLSAGFILPEDFDVEYAATVGELGEHPFWREPAGTAGIVPLEKVKDYQLRPFMQAVSKQGNPAALPTNLQSIDYLRSFSFACLRGNELTGLLLAEASEDGGIYLSALHVLGQSDAPRKLLYAAGRAALEQCAPETPVHTIVVSDASKRLASKLLAGAKMRYICRLAMTISE